MAPPTGRSRILSRGKEINLQLDPKYKKNQRDCALRVFKTYTGANGLEPFLSLLREGKKMVPGHHSQMWTTDIYLSVSDMEKILWEVSPR